ncbi:MAG: hypothetical protein AABW90_03095 [Nanoarchaeota archaeon]
MNLENKVKWAERKDRDKDPIEFFKENYPGMTRSKLAKEDQSLYLTLWKERLLEEVSIASRFGQNPLNYYKQHYKGLTRGQLKEKDPSLYQVLWKGGLLKKVPLKRRK